MIETTEYFDDFLKYYKKAKRVQNKCNLGGQKYIGSCGDPLIENVHIYDTVERKHAGFQNMLQDLWHGSFAPKYYKWSLRHKERNRSYDGLHKRWSIHEWMYVFLFHRLTGSGASFESDHGYRNTVIPSLAEFNTMPQMYTWIRHYNGKMFTSIGNQIPMFPKPNEEYSTGGKMFFCLYANSLVKDLWRYIRSINKQAPWYRSTNPHGIGRTLTIREVTDFMTSWNAYRGLKKFHFQYTAFAADLADYFPQYVNERSAMYYGKNCKEAMSLFIAPGNKIKKDIANDFIMDLAVEKTGGMPRDLEDVMCDYIRYIENYIPENRERTYAHLDKSKIWNDSDIKTHPKGRQKNASQ